MQRSRSEVTVANQFETLATQSPDAAKSMHSALEVTHSESRAGADRNGRVPVHRDTGNGKSRTVRRSVASDEFGDYRICPTYSFA